MRVDTIHQAFHFVAEEYVPLMVYRVNLFDRVLRKEKVTGQIAYLWAIDTRSTGWKAAILQTKYTN